MASENEYMTATEARVRLGISKAKMAQLIREKVLLTEESPLNKRVKLVRRSDVEALASRPRPKLPAVA